MIPNELKQVAKYLSAQQIKLPFGRDGRLDSAIGEDHVAKALLDTTTSKGWKITCPNIGKKNNREWYDVKINEHYCNIKISECTGKADNANAKKAIYYFLTGRPGNAVNSAESVFFKNMKDAENPNEKRDYFYLVVNKTDTKDVFFVSLKGLNSDSVKINPRNPPFQVDWKNNKTPVERDWEQAKEFLLETYAECLYKSVTLTRNGMPKSYPEFFEDKPL